MSKQRKFPEKNIRNTRVYSERSDRADYVSIEEVRAALNPKDLSVPSYFPQQITGPPSLILAQGKPFFASVMEFTRANKRDVAISLPAQNKQFIDIIEST